MEYTLHEPVNYRPRHEYVGLDDVQSVRPAAVVAENDVTPASTEHIDYLWQREAAISALNGIKEVAARGLHRREESFAEVARDEIGIRAKRFFGKIASIGSGLREWGRGIRENFTFASNDGAGSGTLADIGLTGTPYVERRVGHRADRWAATDTRVPDSPAAVTRSFSAEELDELRRIVQERREEHGLPIYESQNS